VEAACADFMVQVNSRVHRTTKRVPTDMFAEEKPRLHRVPDLPHTATLRVTRNVPGNTPMVSFGNPRTQAGPTSRSRSMKRPLRGSV